MEELTKDAIREIEEIHSRWIACEVHGQDQSLLPLCAEDIEFWPPSGPPLMGRAAIAAHMTDQGTKIHRIEITGRRIRGSGEIAYLTANYKTIFSTRDDAASREASGSHLWILRRLSGQWLISLVSWSVW